MLRISTQDYTIDIVVRHYWNDRRLSFNASQAVTSDLLLGHDFANKIWLPDTYFSNGKTVDFQRTSTTEPSILLRINSSGDVLYSTRFDITRVYASLSPFYLSNMNISQYLLAKNLISPKQHPRLLWGCN